MAEITITLNLEKCDSTDPKLGIKCPFLYTQRTPNTGFAVDYFCKIDDQKITGYVEWDSDVPEVPSWCPCKKK